MSDKNHTMSAEWAPFFQCLVLGAVLEAIADHQGGAICLGIAGGDVVQPGSLAQALHSDYPSYAIRSMAQGYSLAVSLATTDIDLDCAPIRIASWSDRRSHKFQESPVDEPVDMADLITMRKGDLLIRDVRCPHGGSYHSGTRMRYLPGFQAFSNAICGGCSGNRCYKHCCWKC